MSAPSSLSTAGGRPAVTLADIAHRCGLSKGSVSRVLSMTVEECPLSEATWKRVREVAAEMGYRANAQARALASGRSMAIGLIYNDTLPQLDSVYYQMIEVFSATLRERGYQLALVAIDEQGQWEDVLLGGRVDGCVCLHRLPPRIEEVIPRLQRPLVLLNGISDAASGAISVDDHGGAVQITEHLLELGHRRILMLTGMHCKTPHCSFAERKEGFLKATEEADGAEGICFDGDTDAFAAAWDQFDEAPTAVVCYSHLEAVGALRVLRRANVDVPGEVSLVTFNDVFPVAELAPALTCVAVPSAEIGRRGAEMLLEMLDHGIAPDQLPGQVELPLSLIMRESTAPAPR